MGDTAQQSSDDAHVLISHAELEELRRFKETVERKEKADAERFAILRERDKENPEERNKRAMEWYTKHKAEVNAKRREAYRLKKELEKANSLAGGGHS